MTPERINEIFRGIDLEENYNFLEDDLAKLAQAYAQEGAKDELVACIKVTTDLNRVVGEKLAEVRGK
jgi:hypothetical protein